MKYSSNSHLLTDYEANMIIVSVANCKVRAVVRFLFVKVSTVAEMHRELCLTYKLTDMSESVSMAA